jgi:hypothetical protein
MRSDQRKKKNVGTPGQEGADPKELVTPSGATSCSVSHFRRLLAVTTPAASTVIAPTAAITTAAAATVVASSTASAAIVTTTTTTAATTATITAAATSAAAAEGAFTSESATAWGTFFAWAGDINGQGTSTEVLAVKQFHRALSLLRSAEFNECKASGAPGNPVHHEVDVCDHTRGTKEVLEITILCLKGQIAHIEPRLGFHNLLINQLNHPTGDEGNPHSQVAECSSRTSQIQSRLDDTDPLPC